MGVAALPYTPNCSKRREPVKLLVYHWTGGTFSSAVDWCLHDVSQVSYHTVMSPTGERRDLIPMSHWPTVAAWAVGFAKVPPGLPVEFRSANHVSINIALAGGPKVAPTEAALAKAVEAGVDAFRLLGWTDADLWRVVGHCDLAVYGPGTPKAGQFGRKEDPWGDGWIKRTELIARLQAGLQQREH